ncbi:Brp/Blh family beta-carotene 15,15'-dioxygenase [Olleya sp. YS]|uniref:Brp/Blh family beta-carotene 15,15'-dioxygenase n=1 Tax=Olleya sp. YS TaxID=3028318 RepID=UPI0024341851|nr:Brp/Blh family beta-carotene 15,15'-dioxygenase [Olleya sp. YS]WGD34674.1 Brp/Blh family beta-carotene 15,15'-dioxygenase [Olleya sp. YS]
MEKIYNLSIVLSFIGLWITSIVPSQLEIIFGFILIFSFGILHGSNDILLIENFSKKKSNHPFIKVLFVYLLTITIAIVIFYFVPILALLLFIVFSAFHFGEQHWESKMTSEVRVMTTTFYLFYGFFVLFLLFIFNAQEVVEVITSITSYTIDQSLVSYGLITSTLIMIFFGSLLNSYIINFKSIIFKELFYLLVFAIVFKVSTLIWGFALYFILWHSIPSLFEQVNFIYGHFTKTSIIAYLKGAFPYWLVSIIGLVTVIYLLKDEKLLYAILFSFIAAITFPHALVINKMFKHKKTQSN